MHEVMLYCTRQRTSAIGAVVEQQQVLERQLECWLPDKCAAVMTNERAASATPLSLLPLHSFGIRATPASL